MTYQESIDYLYATAPMFQSIGRDAYKEGLDTTLALDEMLDHPHAAYRTIHVGGTNGKGSVSQIIYSTLREAGYSVGLYTSPHLKDFRERIVTDGQKISHDEVVEFIERMRPAIESLHPSFFEITTAMAFDHFRRREVDIAVVEVGMGGRLDCTNIIAPMLSVITNIGLDHTQYLGDTLQLIAAEKAGIIKPRTPVIIGEQQTETAPTFISRAHEMEAPIQFASLRYRCTDRSGTIYRIESLMDGYCFDLELGMQGDYQRKNICTALAALDALGDSALMNRDTLVPISDPQQMARRQMHGPLNITSVAVRRGMAAARVAGRWHKLGEEPLVICDTGHNRHGLEYVTGQIAEQSYQKLYMVLGVVADKDLDSILPILPREAHYIFTQCSLPRAMNADILADRCRRSGLCGEVVPTVAEAFERAKALASPQDMIFVGGSTFTVAEVM